MVLGSDEDLTVSVCSLPFEQSQKLNKIVFVIY